LWKCQCGQVVGPEPYCSACGCKTRLTLLDNPEDVYIDGTPLKSTDLRIESHRIFPIRLLGSNREEIISFDENGIFKVNGVETNVDSEIVAGLRVWIKEWSRK